MYYSRNKAWLLILSVAFSIFFVGCSYVDLTGIDTFNAKIISFIFSSTENSSILSTTANGIVGQDSITITVPFGTPLTLTPTIIFEGQTINPGNNIQQTFTEGIPFPYTVTSKDGTSKTYDVYVSVAQNDAKEITAFIFYKVNNPILSADITGTISGTNISVEVPEGTDISTLTPTISYSGSSVDPASETAQAFSDGTGVTYTVTAADTTTQDYTVTVYKPPTAGNSGTLTFTDITDTSITVNWTKAIDDQTVQTDLQYLVYYSTANNIDSITAIEVNGTPFGTYTPDIDSIEVTGLSDSTLYYFNVIVRDQNGNKTAYTMNSEATVDIVRPVPGNSGALTFPTITPFTATINWTKATDNVTLQPNLQYLLYYSENSSSVNTVNSTENTGIPVGSYTTDINSVTVTGLDHSTTYYFNVIVRDEAGNKAIYSKNSTTTLEGIPPGLVTVTAVTEDNTQILFEWTDPVDADLNHIEITWDPDGSTINSINAGIESFTATGLDNDKEYTFSLVSVDHIGNKSAAVTVKVTPSADGPFINYCIYTADDLNAVRGGIKAGWDKTGSYIMMADIDLSGYSPWTPIGDGTDKFTGNLNGNGHKITNLYVNTGSTYQGLFGYITGGTHLVNLTIEDCIIDATGQAFIGALVGVFEGNDKAKISRCYVTGSISGSLYVGGLAGRLAGTSTEALVQYCGVNITLTTTGGYAGGLAGQMVAPWKIEYCYSEGSILGTGSALGGICGAANQYINNSYSRVSINGANTIGGIVGYAHQTSRIVDFCYTTGDITNTTTTFIGGAIGRSFYSGGFPTCFYSSVISLGISNTYGVRKTEVELKVESTYPGWDFTNIWAIDPAINDGYPYLIHNAP